MDSHTAGREFYVNKLFKSTLVRLPLQESKINTTGHQQMQNAKLAKVAQFIYLQYSLSESLLNSLFLSAESLCIISRYIRITVLRRTKRELGLYIFTVAYEMASFFKTNMLNLRTPNRTTRFMNDRD